MPPNESCMYTDPRKLVNYFEPGDDAYTGPFTGCPGTVCGPRLSVLKLIYRGHKLVKSGNSVIV